jgi:hypothetical protein
MPLVRCGGFLALWRFLNKKIQNFSKNLRCKIVGAKGSVKHINDEGQKG